MAEVHDVYKTHHPLKFLIGKNNLLLLVYESHLYKRENGNFPKTNWKCWNGCKANVSTNSGVFQQASPITAHVHPPPVDDIIVIETFMKIKHRVQSEFNLTPREIYTEERMKLKLRGELGAFLKMDSYATCRNTLHRYRMLEFPKVPKQRCEIIVPDEWKLTLDRREQFLLAEDGIDDKILIFGTESNLRILSTSKYVVSDGTFSVHPKIFAQLYVFHGLYLGKVLPLLFCLLPDKTCNTYYRTLVLIKSLAEKLGMTFSPEKFHIDYEQAMIKAISMVFSKSCIQGCLFHFCQSIWRKVQELGLSTAYKNNRAVRQWVRRFCALPFLPISDIDDGFIAIHESAPTATSETVSLSQIESFHDYIVNTWVDDESAVFDRNVWNHFDNDGPRTTNNAEGWHHKLNSDAKSRMTLFKFIHFLQKIQVDLDSCKFDLISQSPSRKPTRYKNINDVIQVAKENYMSGNVSILNYLDSVSVALKLE